MTHRVKQRLVHFFTELFGGLLEILPIWGTGLAIILVAYLILLVCTQVLDLPSTLSWIITAIGSPILVFWTGTRIKDWIEDYRERRWKNEDAKKPKDEDDL